MSSPIAILTAADTCMRPDAPEFSGFFDALRAEGRRTQPIEALTDDTLRGFGALLVGGPRSLAGVGHESHECVRRWIAAGGALLYLCDAVGQDVKTQHTLATHFGHLPAPSTRCVGRWLRPPDARGGGEPLWQPSFDLDVGALVGQPATLSYEFGTTMSGLLNIVDDACRPFDDSVIERLNVPSDARSVTVVQQGDDVLHVPKDDVSTDVRFVADVYLRKRIGRGAATMFGSTRSLRDDALGRGDALTFLQWILRRWLPAHADDEVRTRMARPQRHRMLHAYPMAPLMLPLDDDARASIAALEAQPPERGRGLIVGVLPHPFCNPAVRGCGFCTFPHEAFSQPRAHAVASRVVAEVDAFRARAPARTGGRVESVYLGGGTANLTPADDLVAIGAALARAWDLHDAEVTLEGVPVYFSARGGATLDALERAFPSCARRLSLGVQTFDAEQIARMGRRAFGDREAVAGVVRDARARGMATSADLLFNLPGQSLAQMRDDVDAVVDLGVDHVCLYHLVLFDGLGTEWSHDRSLLAALPDNERACANWIDLRARLLARGFAQTSLTNFERRDVTAPFRYEPFAYAPERHDIVGFGPAALSLWFDPARALKVMNADGADAYARAVDEGSPRARAFAYGPRDARVLYLTRKVVTLGVDRDAYRALFGTDAAADFAMDFEALVDAGLVTLTDARISLTERGMFYADTVAGQLATRQVHDRRVRAGLALGRPAPPRSMRVIPDASAMSAMG